LRGVKRRNDREKDEEEKSFHHWANRLLRNPHPSLLPQGEGTALWCNYGDTRSGGFLSIRERIEVRAVFQQFGRMGR